MQTTITSLPPFNPLQKLTPQNHHQISQFLENHHHYNYPTPLIQSNTSPFATSKITKTNETLTPLPAISNATTIAHTTRSSINTLLQIFPHYKYKNLKPQCLSIPWTDNNTFVNLWITIETKEAIYWGHNMKTIPSSWRVPNVNDANKLGINQEHKDNRLCLPINYQTQWSRSIKFTVMLLQWRWSWIT